MKITIAICAALAAGLLISSAEEKPKATTGSTGQEIKERVDKVDAMVGKIEGRIPNLTRKEAMLDPGALTKITDEKWTKIHTYAAGGKIERLKVYPTAGSDKTEEFYYDNGRLIFAFIEPMGAGKEGHDAKAKGTKYYFDAKGLFATISNGTMDKSLNDKARAMGEKLQRESKAFLKAAK